jgi:hypothetical protein
MRQLACLLVGAAASACAGDEPMLGGADLADAGGPPDRRDIAKPWTLV